MTGSASTSARLAFPSLDAEVCPRVDPRQFAAELDSRYSSLFATVDWVATHDDAPWVGACVLEQPRHVLLFTGRGRKVQVLNKAFAIGPSDAERCCRALFRAFPHVRRIHLEVLFPPSDLRLPKRVLYRTHHMVVDLPTTKEEYSASLSKRMRKHLRTYRNRLEGEFSDIKTEVCPSAGDARVPALFDQFLRWKTDRFDARGQKTYWEKDPRLTGRFLRLLERRGEVRVTTVDGTPAAILFDFPVGCSMCAQESATDPELDYYGMALLSDYWEVCDAISRGFTSLNMLWGSEEHKARLGATRHTATALSVFADQQSRLWSLDEAWEVARRNARRGAAHRYWRARHAVGRRLRDHGGRVTHAVWANDTERPEP